MESAGAAGCRPAPVVAGEVDEQWWRQAVQDASGLCQTVLAHYLHVVCLRHDVKRKRGSGEVAKDGEVERGEGSCRPQKRARCSDTIEGTRPENGLQREGENLAIKPDAGHSGTHELGVDALRERIRTLESQLSAQTQREQELRQEGERVKEQIKEVVQAFLARWNEMEGSPSNICDAMIAKQGEQWELLAKNLLEKAENLAASRDNQLHELRAEKQQLQTDNERMKQASSTELAKRTKEEFAHQKRIGQLETWKDNLRAENAKLREENKHCKTLLSVNQPPNPSSFPPWPTPPPPLPSYTPPPMAPPWTPPPPHFGMCPPGPMPLQHPEAAHWHALYVRAKEEAAGLGRACQEMQGHVRAERDKDKERIRALTKRAEAAQARAESLRGALRDKERALAAVQARLDQLQSQSQSIGHNGAAAAVSRGDKLAELAQVAAGREAAGEETVAQF